MPAGRKQAASFIAARGSKTAGVQFKRCRLTDNGPVGLNKQPLFLEADLNKKTSGGSVERNADSAARRLMAYRMVFPHNG